MFWNPCKALKFKCKRHNVEEMGLPQNNHSYRKPWLDLWASFAWNSEHTECDKFLMRIISGLATKAQEVLHMAAYNIICSSKSIYCEKTPVKLTDKGKPMEW